MHTVKSWVGLFSREWHFAGNWEEWRGVLGWCPPEEARSEGPLQPVAGGPHMEGSRPLPPSSVSSMRPGQPHGIAVGPEAVQKMTGGQ